LLSDQVDTENNPVLTRQTSATEEDVIGLNRNSFTVEYTPGQNERIEIWRMPLTPEQTSERVHNSGPLPNPGSRYRVNLKNAIPGVYQIRQIGDNPNRELIYLDDELYRSNASGVVEIYRFPPVDYSVATNYYVKFKRRTNTWKYGVLTGNIPSNEITLTSTLNNDPNYPDNIAFTAVATADQSPEERREMLAFSDQPTLLFRSDTDLPYYEAPLRNLAVRRLNGPAGSTLIEHLPNPDVRRPSATVFITL
jgi:hypothetical protein